MSHLLRLYPRSWRERYGDEMLALLAAQPASLLDHLDLIRGAFDAHLHPQVRGSAVAPEDESSMNQRLLGVLAAIGGVAWLLGTGTALVLPPDQYGDPDVSLTRIGVAMGTSLIGIALGELGTRPGSLSWTGHAIAVIGVVLGLTALLPWPWFMFCLLGFPLLAIAAAARAYQTGRLQRWAAGAFMAACVLALVGIFGVTNNVYYFALIGGAGLILAVAALRPPASAPAGPAQEPA